MSTCGTTPTAARAGYNRYSPSLLCRNMSPAARELHGSGASATRFLCSVINSDTPSGPLLPQTCHHYTRRFLSAGHADDDLNRPENVATVQRMLRPCLNT